MQSREGTPLGRMRTAFSQSRRLAAQRWMAVGPSDPETMARWRSPRRRSGGACGCGCGGVGEGLEVRADGLDVDHFSAMCPTSPERGGVRRVADGHARRTAPGHWYKHNKARAQADAVLPNYARWPWVLGPGEPQAVAPPRRFVPAAVRRAQLSPNRTSSRPGSPGWRPLDRTKSAHHWKHVAVHVVQPQLFGGYAPTRVVRPRSFPWRIAGRDVASEVGLVGGTVVGRLGEEKGNEHSSSERARLDMHIPIPPPSASGNKKPLPRFCSFSFSFRMNSCNVVPGYALDREQLQSSSEMSLTGVGLHRSARSGWGCRQAACTAPASHHAGRFESSLISVLTLLVPFQPM